MLSLNQFRQELQKIISSSFNSKLKRRKWKESKKESSGWMACSRKIFFPSFLCLVNMIEHLFVEKTAKSNVGTLIQENGGLKTQYGTTETLKNLI
jgi:hypothetical protein